MSETPPTPKRRLIDLLTQPAETQRLCEFARMVHDGPHALIRTALMLSGMKVPEDQDGEAHFVAALLHCGFQIVPAFLGVPEIGDLYVATDAQGEPVETGFVAKFPSEAVGPNGRLKERPTWFQALHEVPGAGERAQIRREIRPAEGAAVTLWLRLVGG